MRIVICSLYGYQIQSQSKLALWSPYGPAMNYSGKYLADGLCFMCEQHKY